MENSGQHLWFIHQHLGQSILVTRWSLYTSWCCRDWMLLHIALHNTEWPLLLKNLKNPKKTKSPQKFLNNLKNIKNLVILLKISLFLLPSKKILSKWMDYMLNRELIFTALIIQNPIYSFCCLFLNQGMFQLFLFDIMYYCA